VTPATVNLTKAGTTRQTKLFQITISYEVQQDKIATGVVGHYWKVFSRSWENIALSCWPQVTFPQLCETISNNDWWRQSLFVHF